MGPIGKCCAVALLSGLVASALAQQQVLLSGATTKALEEISKVNAQLGVHVVRDLADLKDNKDPRQPKVLTVPVGNEGQWLDLIGRIRTDSQSGFVVTPLGGDYRSLFHPRTSLGDLSPAQSQALQALRQAFGAEQVNVVQLAPPALAQQIMTTGFGLKDSFASPGTMNVQVEPGRTISLSNQSSAASEGGYVWRGRPTSDNGAPVDGDATLVAKGDRITGSIRVDRDVYTIIPIGGGAHAISKQGTAGGPPEHPPRYLEKLKQAPGFDAPPSVPLGITETVRIDVLVVFSRQASAGLADPDGLVTLAVEETNQSFRNSAIDGVRLRSVGVMPSTYSESGNWNDHLDRLANTADPAFRSTHQRRDQLKADVVVLVVADQTWCGEGRALNAQAATAFAVVSLTCLNQPRYSFAHELGHLLGARHDRQTDPELSPFKWAHGYTNALKWRTLMAYDTCGGCKRVLHWSNPTVFQDEDPTGTMEFEYDARVWLEHARRISNFR